MMFVILQVMPKQEACGCKNSKLVCGPCFTTRSANFTFEIGKVHENLVHCFSPSQMLMLIYL